MEIHQRDKSLEVNSEYVCICNFDRYCQIPVPLEPSQSRDARYNLKPFYLEIHNEKWVYLLKNWQAGHIQQFAEYVFTQKYIQQKFIVLLSTLETHTHIHTHKANSNLRLCGDYI